MRQYSRSFCAALAIVSVIAGPVHASESLKPYVVLIVDTSGSMDESTNTGPPSCGGADTKIDHAKCAINNIANSYGDMVLALAQFRQSSTDGDCTDGCTVTSGCGDAANNRDHRFDVLVPLIDGNNDDIATWTDFTCGTCGRDIAQNPDMVTGSSTPIAGSLWGAQRYWQGLQASDSSTYWPAGEPGFSPIVNDPLATSFLPSGAQCRPYIVISLTDGNESCSGSPTAAAAALLSTVVNVGGVDRTYRIETKAIGFGIAPGDGDIEALAQAGGAINGPGNEGTYASNEEDLQLGISQIIADAIRAESCNDLDDDCDVLIDEDFPSKGTVCDDGELGICRGTGTWVCRADGTGTECMIGDPGDPSTTESCNDLDDDCDGQVDEGACQGCGDVEVCDDVDNDCDGTIDEALVRSCGTDVGECTAGTEACSAGDWLGCTATGGTPEACDGLDNDCDGLIDGFSRTCSAIPGGNPETGVCTAGTQVCVQNGAGTWTTCAGEIGPSGEGCNLQDDDCDGSIDESTGGADCSSACGIGTTVCTDGVLLCDSQVAPNDDTCNNVDDDCDGIIDENVADGATCDANGTICEGVEICVNGGFQCMGTPIREESCDCDDNDCDTEVDENNGNCPSGATCTSCQCAFPCADDEFPCPSGRLCNDDGFCVLDPCFGVVCNPTPEGAATECVGGLCVDACLDENCPSGTVCFAPSGQCAADDCSTFPDRCAANQACVAGVCVADPCADVSCGTDQYCAAGTCVTSCADITCPGGQRCELGGCVADPCGAACPAGQVCETSSGTCIANQCVGVDCQVGQACDPATGDCIQDPCLGVTCPEATQICQGGSCYAPHQLEPGFDPDVVTVGGSGCATGSASGVGAGLALMLLGLLVRPRRRRSQHRSSAKGGV